MKIKVTIFLILITTLIILINFTNKDNEIYYVNIDSTNSLEYNNIITNQLIKTKKLEKNVNKFSKKDYRTTDLIRDIKDNKKIENQTIQNALIKADILTIYIGINDINYKIGDNSKENLYNYTDQVLLDIEELLKLVKIYCKEKIYVIGYKNEIGISYNDYFEYTNKRLKAICDEYKMEFININKKDDITNIVSETVLKDIY
ncbi:MAG: SGNH/GDSL hydrolase family protein [Bacilli bacterium]|nr:SGNH/GDSL hydrolase family protein [Bacilli bacterium]